jgi:hypothetical protein
MSRKAGWRPHHYQKLIRIEALAWTVLTRRPRIHKPYRRLSLFWRADDNRQPLRRASRNGGAR